MIGIAQLLAAKKAEADRLRDLTALRRCPFCGYEPRLVEDPVTHFAVGVPCSARVVCPACGAEGPDYVYPLA